MPRKTTKPPAAARGEREYLARLLRFAIDEAARVVPGDGVTPERAWHVLGRLLSEAQLTMAEADRLYARATGED